MTGFRLGDGTVLEIYGPADDFRFFSITGPVVFSITGPVVGFGAGDFDVARAAMPSAEVEFTGAIQHADGVSWRRRRAWFP